MRRPATGGSHAVILRTLPILVLLVSLTFSSLSFCPSLWAQSLSNRQAPSQADPDLVIPQTETETDQDAITTDKMKESDVSGDDAQQRRPAPKVEHYLELVPSEDVDQPLPVDKQLKNGTKLYKLKRHETHYSAGLRVGGFNPTQLQGDQAGITYNEIYGGGIAMIDFNYEWQFMRKFGILGVRGDLGLFTTKGNGRFLHTPSEVANEVLTLLGLPLAGGLVYHLQYWRKQLFVPYVEGGGDFIPFFEIRSDLPSLSQDLKYATAFAAHVAGGLQIQLDYLDQQESWNLYDEYGINHIYLTLDVRQLVGLSNPFNFTSTIFEGGFLVEF